MKIPSFKNQVIGTGWLDNGLDMIPLPIRQKSHAILFYSNANTPDQIAKIFSYRNAFKSVTYFDIEDFEAEDMALDITAYTGPNKNNMKALYENIHAHSDEDMIVSCAAGVSRTGATIKYLESLGYKLNPDDSISYQNFEPNQLMGIFFHYFDSKYSQYNSQNEGELTVSSNIFF